jgi:hypothetical protein
VLLQASPSQFLDLLNTKTCFQVSAAFPDLQYQEGSFPSGIKLEEDPGLPGIITESRSEAIDKPL